MSEFLWLDHEFWQCKIKGGVSKWVDLERGLREHGRRLLPTVTFPWGVNLDIADYFDNIKISGFEDSDFPEDDFSQWGAEVGGGQGQARGAHCSGQHSLPQSSVKFCMNL